MRLAPLALVVTLLSLTALTACDEEPKKGGEQTTSRFAAVKKETNANTARASSSFCEKQWPAAAEGGKRFQEPPERPIPGAPGLPPTTKGAWTWVNLWATWCHPCVEEMGLLARWKDSLQKDGIALNLEMYSVDEQESDLTAWLKKSSMPGRVHWLRSAEDLGPVLESLGAEKTSAIPVHALVDGNGNLRCLRVGSVHDEDYAAIKTMLSGA